MPTDSAGPQGLTPVLQLRLGSTPGGSFRVKHLGGEFLQQGRQGGALEATLSGGWKELAVIAGTKEKARYWLLVPGERADEIAFDEFFVRGRFEVASKSNNAQTARELFKAARSG